MTTALIHTIPTEFVGPNVDELPVYLPDPLLTEGSLLLLDPTHPESPAPAGVLASGAILPNIAEEFARPILGLGNLGAPLNYEFAAGAGFVERTGKGAIHVAVDKTGLSTAARILFPLALANYIHDNPTHDFYFSIWEKTTRAATVDESYLALTMSTSPGPSQLEVSLAVNTDMPVSNTLGSSRNPLGDHRSKTPVPFNVHVARAVSEYTGTIGRTGENAIANNMAKIWNVGNSGPFSAGSAGGRSAAFMRAYVEDLTVSGRSFTAVNLLDAAHFAKVVLSDGGRYYDDTTYTNPTTLD